MSADDDWVVKLKFDTKAIADAIKKINDLKAAMAKLHGGKDGTAKAKSDHKAIEALNAKKQKTEEAAQKKAAKAAEAKRQKAIDDNKKLLNSILNSEEKRANATIAADKKIAENKKKLDASAAKRQELVDKRDARNRSRGFSSSVRAANLNARLYHGEMDRSESEAHRINNARNRAARKAERDRQMGFSSSVTAANHNERLRSRHLTEAESEAHRINSGLNRASTQAELARQQRLSSSVRASSHIAGLRQRHENSEERMGVGRTGLTDTASHAGRRLDREGVRGIEGSTLRRRVSEVQSNISSATTPAALAAARNEMRALNREINLAVANQRRHTAEVERGNFAVRSMSNSMANMARSYLSIFAVFSVGSDLYERAKDMENLSISTLMATGSAEKAAEAFTKIKDAAEEAGLPIKDMASLYNNVVISAKDAKLSVESQEAMFKGITVLEVAYGLGKEQSKGVTKAFSQMLSKQSVKAEEFTGQLLEHAPGAIGHMQEAGGFKSADDMFAAMRKGKIDLKILEKFIGLVRKEAESSGAWEAGINRTQSSENRLGSSIDLLAKALLGFLKSDITGVFGTLQSTFEGWTKSLEDEATEQKKTGKIGPFRDLVDTVTEAFRIFIDGFDYAAEGLFELGKMFHIVSSKGTLKEFLADKEMERAYFKSRGVTSEREKAKVHGGGMTGYGAFVKTKAMAMGASEQEADAIAAQYMERMLGQSVTQTLTVSPTVSTIYGPVSGGTYKTPNKNFSANLLAQGLNQSLLPRANIPYAKDYNPNVYHIYPTITFGQVPDAERARDLTISSLKDLMYPN